MLGVDLDPNSILYADKFNRLNNVKFACGDAFKLESSKVDVVFAIDILEHLPADSHIDFTEKCLSLVKSDGMVCMTTPNALDEADEAVRTYWITQPDKSSALFQSLRKASR